MSGSSSAQPRSSRARRRHPGPTTWNKITGELSQLTLGTFTGPAGTFRQAAGLTPAQRDIFASLRIPCPDKIIEAAQPRPQTPGENRASA